MAPARTRLSATALAVCACLVSAAPRTTLAAEAAEPVAQTDAQAAARTLFDEGRKLMDAEDYAAACPKLAESYRLNPGGGTLLNLALCHEKVGKTATAWAEFREAERLARRDERPDRAAFATEHAGKLESVLSHLRIVVPAGARAAGLEVRRNGVLVGEGAWGESIPVDPGEQVVEVTAPSRRRARKVATVAPGGGSAEITIEPLEAEEMTRSVVTSRPGAAPPRGTASSGSTERTIGLVTGGVGLVALGVGGYLGLTAQSLGKSADEACPKSGYCSAAGIEDSRSAVRDANLATAFFIGGAALVGTGIAVYFLSPSPQVNVGIAGAPGLAGARVSGAF